jgi:predicted amidophosphoribosyltransferase
MIVRCGACQEQMTVGPELMGERVCCPSCGVTVRVPGAVAPVAVQPVVPPPVRPVAVQPIAPPPVRPVAVQPVVPRVVVPPGRGALVHRCPRCGAEVEHGNTLCPHCGVNIKRARKKARRF